jgi:hypothetical protein
VYNTVDPDRNASIGRFHSFKDIIATGSRIFRLIGSAQEKQSLRVSRSTTYIYPTTNIRVLATNHDQNQRLNLKTSGCFGHYWPFIHELFTDAMDGERQHSK